MFLKASSNKDVEINYQEMINKINKFECENAKYKKITEKRTECKENADNSSTNVMNQSNCGTKFEPKNRTGVENASKKLAQPIMLCTESISHRTSSTATALNSKNDTLSKMPANFKKNR